MDMLFQEGKGLPPLFKNQPPVAGSVFWERSLFLRMKNTIIKFLTMEDMMMTERGKAVSDGFLFPIVQCDVQIVLLVDAIPDHFRVEISTAHQ